MEASYVGGPGVLLARSRRWLLLDDDPPRGRLDEWWELLGTAGPVRERLLASLESTYPRQGVSMVLVDLDDPAPAVTWGQGRIDIESGVRRLTVGVDGFGSARPLLAGVVPAAAVELHAPQPTGSTVIDGIPADILASTAQGPPSHRPRFLPADATSHSHADEPDHGYDDDVEITVPRALSDVLGTEHVADADAPDYETEANEHLRQSTHETVLAVNCPAGHVTPAYTPTCRVCRMPVPPQEPRRVARPRLGGLRLPTGEVVPLDRGVVFGRKPAPIPGSNDWPHLVHLPQDSTYVSRLHLQIELDGWLVLARDLGSRGGTTLRVPGRLPQRIRARERYILEPGHALDLADVYEITYEVTP